METRVRDIIQAQTPNISDEFEENFLCSWDVILRGMTSVKEPKTMALKSWRRKQAGNFRHFGTLVVPSVLAKSSPVSPGPEHLPWGFLQCFVSSRMSTRHAVFPWQTRDAAIPMM